MGIFLVVVTFLGLACFVLSISILMLLPRMGVGGSWSVSMSLNLAAMSLTSALHVCVLDVALSYSA